MKIRGYPLTPETQDIVVRVNEIIWNAFPVSLIPKRWFKEITYDNGKPNVVAITVLAEIVYWYRAIVLEDDDENIHYRKKFIADKVQKSYQTFMDEYGFSKRQVRAACHHLSDLGIIDLEFRSIIFTGGVRAHNVLYIGIYPDRLEEISEPLPKP